MLPAVTVRAARVISGTSIFWVAFERRENMITVFVKSLIVRARMGANARPKTTASAM